MSNQQLVEHVWGWNSGIWGPRVGAAIFAVWQVITFLRASVSPSIKWG